MKLEHVRGDIFTTTWRTSLAHGCNCAGAMGKGIAVEFKKRWPAMYKEYRERCRTGYFRLGQVMAWEEPKTLSRRIFNLATQQHYQGCKADLSAINASMARMLRIAVDDAGYDAECLARHTVAMPLIGTGLGGLPATDVIETIESVVEIPEFRRSPLTLQVCVEYVPGLPLEPHHPTDSPRS